MTIEQMFEKRLFESGLFENEAKEIMTMVKADEVNKPFEGKWGEDENAYPQPMLNLLWFSVKQNTLKWIDKNCPKAWFRPMFESKGENK